MILVVVPTLAHTKTFKCQMISVATVGLLLFFRFPRLSPRCTKDSLRVLNKRETRVVNMIFPE